jgi:acetyl-CoA C-acetyltransferase
VPSSRDAVIVGGARTPFARLNGALAPLPAAALGGAAIAGALERAGVPATDVDAVVMGHVVQAGCGQNPARQAAIAAGIGWDVPTVTVNKVCLSGLAAVTDAARQIRLGEAEVIVAGGQESMSLAPHLLPGSRQGWTYGDVPATDSLARDGLTDAFDGLSMGSSTEARNADLGIGRQAQDEVAAASHQRAAAAQRTGVFDAEIVPVEVPQRRGTATVAADEGVRPDTTPDTLAGLRPAFAAGGTITAGNSSPLSDGAAALVVVSRTYAETHGLHILATVGAAGQDVQAPTRPCTRSPPAPSRPRWTRPAGPSGTWISLRSTRRSAPWPCSR